MMTTNKIELKELACQNISLVLDKLGVTYCQKGAILQSSCPCKQHGGDGSNRTAFSWHEEINHWRCWSHGCQDTYGDDVVGLVRSILDCSYHRALAFLKDVLEGQATIYSGNNQHRNTIISNRPLKEELVEFLDYNNTHSYLLQRGLCHQILAGYQVGYWHRLGSFMHDRVIVPIRDEHMNLIGFSGRTVYPENEWDKRHIVSKWLHGRYYDRWSNTGEFLKTKILYNLCYAKESARQLNTMILVEGPFDGFKLQEAKVRNWCGILGTSFNDYQVQLLIKNGINRLALAFDPDQAGNNLAIKIKEKFGDILDITDMKLIKEPGDMSLEEIYVRFKDFICV